MKKIPIAVIVFFIVMNACGRGPVSPEPGRAATPIPEGAEYSGREAPRGLTRAQRADFFMFEGLNLYAQAQYGRAAAFFRSAILEDSMYLYPHFHLARALTKLREAGALNGKGEEELFDELAVCSGLDATRLKLKENWMVESLKSDTDFASLRPTPRFQSLLAKGPTADPAWAGVLAGDWSDFSGYHVLNLNDDSSFFYKIQNIRRGKDRLNQDARGSWGIDENKSLTLTGEPLSSETADGQADDGSADTLTAEFDAEHFVIVLYANAKKMEPSFELRKRTSPLLSALLAPDVPLAARLLSLGVMPPYGTIVAERKRLLNPLDFALESDRGALVRLILGKEGFGLRSAMRGSAVRIDNRYRPLLEYAVKRNSRERLEKEAATARYSVDWYEKLMNFDPGNAQPAGDAEPTPFRSGRGVKGIAIRSMGRNKDYLAVLTSPAVYIIPLNAEGGISSAEVNIYDPRGRSGVNRRYAELTESDAGILGLMDSEKEWVPLFSQYGIEPDNSTNKLLSFPLDVKGKSISLDVSTTQPQAAAEGNQRAPGEAGEHCTMDDGRGPPPLARYHLIINGKSRFRSEDFPGDLTPLGGLAVGNRLCVFISFADFDEGKTKLVFAFFDL